MQDFVYLMIGAVIVISVIGIIAVCDYERRKAQEKRERDELMRQHPHAAVEILRSYDEREARRSAGIQKDLDRIHGAFDNMGKPKAGGGAVKVIVPLICLVYIISPFDFVPDIPVIGWGDDVLAGVIGLRTLFK